MAAVCACTPSAEQPAQFATAPVRLAPLVDAVLATGTVQTVTSVEVSSQLSGRVDKVFVDFNDTVEAAQPLAELDTQQYASRVAELRAGLAVATAEYAAAQAALVGAEGELQEARRDYQRKQSLFEKGTVSSSVRDESRTNHQSAESSVRSLTAQLGTKRAAIAVAEAALRQGEIDLERTTIRAPIDGIVIKRSIEPGQTVAASLEAPELFIIAHDLNEIEVHAKVDEADIGKIKAEQKVAFQVDAHPGRQFSGTVSQVRKAPEMLQNVVTYTAVIAAENPDELMLPGMTAIVEIISMQKPEVVQIPNAALRFTPPESGPAPAPNGPYSARVWRLSASGGVEPVIVAVGYSDGEFTEITDPALVPGDAVIVGYRQ